MKSKNVISKLVDQRNNDLWEKICSNYNVTINFSNNDEYSVFSINKDVTFYVVEDNLCPDSFTHELLHVYFRLKECYFGSALKRTIEENNVLSMFYSVQLLEHISNCLEHSKMFPFYCKMGFDESKFLLDFSIHKCTTDELQDIKNNYYIGDKLNPLAVDFFMGKFFAMKCDPNPMHDYTFQLSELQKIDPLLYNCNLNLLSAWLNFNFEKQDNNGETYYTIILDYLEELNQWINSINGFHNEKKNSSFSSLFNIFRKSKS